jgi:TRAP-type C4-dicarboxylate transport system permease small subunit
LLKRLHRTIDHGLRRVENAAVVGAGGALVIVMVLVSVDAVLRRGLRRPLTFQLPLSENYLLVALVMLALAWGYRRGGTIQVRLLLDRLPKQVADSLLRVALAVSSIYMITLAWLAWAPFYRAWVNHEVIMGVIDWPVAWSWIWVPLGCGLLGIRLAVDATASVPPTPGHHGKETPGTEIL